MSIVASLRSQLSPIHPDGYKFIAIFAGFAKSALLVPTAEALGQLKWDWYQSKPKKMLDFEILDSASRGPLGSMMLLTRSKGM